jgi:hypothetical protein
MPNSLDTVRNILTNPARSYMFEMVIPNLLGGGDSGALTAQCQAAEIPEYSISAIHIPYKQSAGFDVPGIPKYDPWNTTFIETEDLTVYKALYGWQNLINDRANNTGLGDGQIRKDIYLNLLKTSDNSIYTKFRMIGGYPEAVGKVALQYGQDQLIQVSVTWKFVRWEIV